MGSHEGSKGSDWLTFQPLKYSHTSIRPLDYKPRASVPPQIGLRAASLTKLQPGCIDCSVAAVEPEFGELPPQGYGRTCVKRRGGGGRERCSRDAKHAIRRVCERDVEKERWRAGAMLSLYQSEPPPAPLGSDWHLWFRNFIPALL